MADLQSFPAKRKDDLLPQKRATYGEQRRPDKGWKRDELLGNVSGLFGEVLEADYGGTRMAPHAEGRR